jgi:hypothetical protein
VNIRVSKSTGALPSQSSTASGHNSKSTISPNSPCIPVSEAPYGPLLLPKEPGGFLDTKNTSTERGGRSSLSSSGSVCHDIDSPCLIAKTSLSELQIRHDFLLSDDPFSPFTRQYLFSFPRAYLVNYYQRFLPPFPSSLTYRAQTGQKTSGSADAEWYTFPR